MVDMWTETNMLGMSKQELFARGVLLARLVLIKSGFTVPVIKVNDNIRSKGVYDRNGKKMIEVKLLTNRPATKNPGFSWSFPGWKADLTPIGVVTHEAGHHVYDTIGRPTLTGWSKEPRVSTYEPNSNERFAEAVKLFMTNPDLLRVGRPTRYEFLSRYLTPVVEGGWWDILRTRGAHDKYEHAARRWMEGLPAGKTKTKSYKDEQIEKLQAENELLREEIAKLRE